MRNDFESNYLMHHGILGQKWGDKNGPPYPLDAGDHSPREKRAGWIKSLKAKSEAKKKKKKQQKQQENLAKARAAKQAKAQAAAEAKRKEEEWSKKKEEILRSADPKLIMQYRDKLTDQEMQNALNRVRNENEMNKFIAESQKSGMEKIDGFMKKADKVMDWGKTAARGYNIAATLYNTFIAEDSSEKWKVIPANSFGGSGGGDGGGKKKKKK